MRLFMSSLVKFLPKCPTMTYLSLSILACVQCGHVYAYVCYFIYLLFYKHSTSSYHGIITFMSVASMKNCLKWYRAHLIHTHVCSITRVHYHINTVVLGSQLQINNAKEVCLILHVRNFSNVIVIYANLT